MNEPLYKVLRRGPDGKLLSCHGGSATWTVGRKKSCTGELVACENGIHLCREGDLVHWLNEVICPVTAHSDEMVVAGDKVVVRWATIGKPLESWNEESARLFAVDCARLALPYAAEGDRELLSACLDITTAYAFDNEEWAAAWATARDAAWAAAGAAARDAAWAAAGDAAWAAAKVRLDEWAIRWLEDGVIPTVTISEESKK